LSETVVKKKGGGRAIPSEKKEKRHKRLSNVTLILFPSGGRRYGGTAFLREKRKEGELRAFPVMVKWTRPVDEKKKGGVARDLGREKPV